MNKARSLSILLLVALGLVPAVQPSIASPGVAPAPGVKADGTFDPSLAPEWVPGAGYAQDTLLVDAATGHLACFESGLRGPIDVPPAAAVWSTSRRQANPSARPLQAPTEPIDWDNPPVGEEIEVPAFTMADTPGLIAVPADQIPAGATCDPASTEPTVFVLDYRVGARLTVPAGQQRALPASR